MRFVHSGILSHETPDRFDLVFCAEMPYGRDEQKRKPLQDHG
ncbi:hypothetical protein [Sphaerimonospora mesophila]